MVETMGASLAGRLGYAGLGRLDGIGSCAIGVMVASGVTSIVAISKRLKSLLIQKHYRLCSSVVQG
jgi:hypothetical protein